MGILLKMIFWFKNPICINLFSYMLSPFFRMKFHILEYDEKVEGRGDRLLLPDHAVEAVVEAEAVEDRHHIPLEDPDLDHVLDLDSAIACHSELLRIHIRKSWLWFVWRC